MGKLPCLQTSHLSTRSKSFTNASSQHKPGNEQGNEAAPEFHAETHAPGSAPPSQTFQPNPTNETPAPGAGSGVDFPNWTSKDVHNAHSFDDGRPMQGQTSREVRGAHPGKNKREQNGLLGVGAADGEGDTVEGKVREQAADRGKAERGVRGKSGAVEGGVNWPGAEGVPSERAERA